MANGTAPIEASSGRVVRHRLNRGGNRQLNKALHIAAIAQIRRPDTEQATPTTSAACNAARPNAKRPAPSNGASQTASGRTSNTQTHPLP